MAASRSFSGGIGWESAARTPSWKDGQAPKLFCPDISGPTCWPGFLEQQIIPIQSTIILICPLWQLWVACTQFIILLLKYARKESLFNQLLKAILLWQLRKSLNLNWKTNWKSMITANFKSPKHTLLGICVRLIVFEAVLIIFEAVLLQFLCAVFFIKCIYVTQKYGSSWSLQLLLKSPTHLHHSAASSCLSAERDQLPSLPRQQKPSSVGTWSRKGCSVFSWQHLEWTNWACNDVWGCLKTVAPKLLIYAFGAPPYGHPYFETSPYSKHFKTAC